MPRRVHRWHVFGAVASVCVLILVAGGCGDKSTGPEPGGQAPFQYLPPDSPQNVLQNLVSAYTRRDSVETAAVYDSTYEGTSTDPAAPIPVLNFTRADEIHHVGVLKRDSDIVSVLVDFGSPTLWQRLPAYASDPADWAVIPILFARVEVVDAGTMMLHQSTNQPMEYTFKPTVSAPGDTTWTVVRWVEIAN